MAITNGRPFFHNAKHPAVGAGCGVVGCAVGGGDVVVFNAYQLLPYFLLKNQSFSDFKHIFKSIHGIF